MIQNISLLKATSKKNLEIIAHIIFWGFPSFLMIQFKMVEFGNTLSSWETITPFLANVIVNAAIVYSIILYLGPKYRNKSFGRQIFTVLILGTFLVGVFLKVGINYLFFTVIAPQPSIKIGLGELIILEFILAFFFVVQALLFFLVKERIKTSIVNRKLNEEKLILELKYLKSQINPHFLFNTLNNLYSMALTNQDITTANGISQLSQIMRYMLTDSEEKEIFLEKEIQYLKSYIELQKLRFSETDDITINIQYSGELGRVKIPPFLFIVFVENAFKYGIDYKSHSFVDIYFQVLPHGLLFEISNSVKQGEHYQKHGIGLKNIKERLNLLYPDKHQLRIQQTADTYQVELELTF